MHMKCSPVDLSHVIYVFKGEQVALQTDQLIVLLTFEWKNGHPVVNVEPVCKQ
jgi:hypothetical protein